MHKRSFQALKCTVMQVSILPHHILIKKTNYLQISFFKSKYGGGSLDICINVRFRP